MSGVSMGVERGIRARERFGDALKARRLSAGISEVRVATAIGARLSEVRAWERGDRLPDPNAVRALIRLLQVDSAVALDWLDLTGVDQEIRGDGREVAILLLSDDAPADPFGGPPVVVDLTSRVRAVKPTPRTASPAPAPTRHSPLSDMTPRSVSVPATASVFPEPGGTVYVYSNSVPEPPDRVRGITRRRRLVTVVALAALGLVLWWAFGELGSGLSTMVDRLGHTGGLVVTG